MSEWLEKCIRKKHIKYYEYNKFSNIERIGGGAFSNVYRAKWEYSEKYFALKSFNLDKITVDEIVKEVIRERER